MTLWIVFTALLVLALGFVVWPLFRHTRGLTPGLAALIIVVVSLSAGLYWDLGSPDVESGRSELPVQGSGPASETDVAAMVAQLEARLAREPDDVEGWMLLARSYQTLEEFDKAAAAYEKVLEHAPMHPQALFYGGFIAASRGEYNLAADRWESVMRVATPPDDVRENMERQISIWRGEAPTVDSAPPETSDAVVTAVITLSEDAASTVPAGATLFVIARDPQQPAPPIAVARRVLNAAPMIVELGDRDAMVPGRTLSAFQSFELLARISLSGTAMAQPGDWYGAVQFTVGDNNVAEVVIDTPVE